MLLLLPTTVDHAHIDGRSLPAQEQADLSTRRRLVIKHLLLALVAASIKKITLRNITQV
nr:hypothetical protein [Halomonas sp.]